MLEMVKEYSKVCVEAFCTKKMELPGLLITLICGGLQAILGGALEKSCVKSSLKYTNHGCHSYRLSL